MHAWFVSCKIYDIRSGLKVFVNGLFEFLVELLCPLRYYMSYRVTALASQWL